MSFQSACVREITMFACSPQNTFPFATIILQKRFFFSTKKPHLQGGEDAMLDMFRYLGDVRTRFFFGGFTHIQFVVLAPLLD